MPRIRHGRALLYPLLFLVLSPIMELLNRPFSKVYVLATTLDEMIPFVPAFVLTYHSWMPSLILTAVLFFFLALRAEASEQQELPFWKSKSYHFYRDYCLALIAGQGLAHLTFPFFQTYVPRHVFTNPPSGLLERLVAQTYTVDNPYCGFPSIHVLSCCLAIYFIAKSPLPPLYKFLISGHFIAIIASTLLIKQHVFWDLPGGLLYALAGLALLPLSRRVADALESRISDCPSRHKRPEGNS